MATRCNVFVPVSVSRAILFLAVLSFHAVEDCCGLVCVLGWLKARRSLAPLKSRRRRQRFSPFKICIWICECEERSFSSAACRNEVDGRSTNGAWRPRALCRRRRVASRRSPLFRGSARAFLMQKRRVTNFRRRPPLYVGERLRRLRSENDLVTAVRASHCPEKGHCNEEVGVDRLWCMYLAHFWIESRLGVLT